MCCMSLSLALAKCSCVPHVAGILDGRNGWVYVALPTAIAVAVLMGSTFLVLRWRMPGKRVLKKRGRAATETEKQVAGHARCSVHVILAGWAGKLSACATT